MKNTSAILFTYIVVLMFSCIQTTVFAQSEPVMYFCERYDSLQHEIGVRDCYKTGPITVMVKCDTALNLTSVAIEYDKYNFNNNTFNYYKKFYFEIESKMNYITFFMDKENELAFDTPGFYRVILLDENDKRITSALVEIID